jgi:signal transduction histidine kinase
MILDDSLPIISFDHQRIRQVCINLLNNALKFSGRGGKVFITTKQEGDEVIVSVRDSGPGIDKDDIPDIFENFTQIDGGDTRSKDGLGIGLRLVKHYIDLHKGRIWVESEKGKGSRFCFSLPVKRNHEVPRN